jgi:hypothetical protein
MPDAEDGPGIIGLAFGMSKAVADFIGRARAFFYEVMLSDRPCPHCCGRLDMIGEGQCRCKACGKSLDPTVVFQRCTACGGRLVLQIRRYACQQCGADTASRFLFTGLVFDAEYFRQKMAEHRQRKLELREQVRQMLVGTRSQPLMPMAANLEDVQGLLEALNHLTDGVDASGFPWPTAGFNLKLYESHLLAHIGAVPVDFEEIPPLGQAARLDRVWRFITILFLANTGCIDVWQEGQAIWVIKHETDREGQDVSGDLEDADGVQGPIRGAESW